MRVRVAAIKLTVIVRLVNGRPLQLLLMNENRRCSTLFHLIVPGGRWRAEMDKLLSVASGRRFNDARNTTNHPGPIAWDAKPIVLFPTKDSNKFLLPFEANVQLRWKGKVAGGAALADGNCTLCLRVTDGDGKFSDCDTSMRYASFSV